MSENNTKKRRFVSRIQVFALLPEIQDLAAKGYTKIGIYEHFGKRLSISYAQFCRALIQYCGMEKRKKAKNHSMKKSPEAAARTSALPKSQQLSEPQQNAGQGAGQGVQKGQATASAAPDPVPVPSWKTRIVRSKEWISESEFEELSKATEKLSYGETEKYIDANGYKGRLDMSHLTRLYAGKNMFDDI